MGAWTRRPILRHWIEETAAVLCSCPLLPKVPSWPPDGHEGVSRVTSHHATVAILASTTLTSLLKSWNAFLGHGWSLVHWTEQCQHSCHSQPPPSYALVSDQSNTLMFCLKKLFLKERTSIDPSTIFWMPVMFQPHPKCQHYWKHHFVYQTKWSHHHHCRIAVLGQTTWFPFSADISSMKNPHTGPLYIVYHIVQWPHAVWRNKCHNCNFSFVLVASFPKLIWTLRFRVKIESSGFKESPPGK